MLQRIQTVWFLLALISLALLFRFPAAGNSSTALIASFNISGQWSMSGSLLFAIILITICIVILITIFKFRNRKLQMRLCRIINILTVLLILFIAVSCWHFEQTLAFSWLKPGFALPFLSIFFQYLAYRGIKHDEELIKSADRIR